MSGTSEYWKARSDRAREDSRKESLYPPSSQNYVQVE